MSLKFTIGVLIGAAAGAAIMHYLDTEEGKVLMSRIRKDLCDLEENVEDAVADLIAKGRSFVGKAEANA